VREDLRVMNPIIELLRSRIPALPSRATIVLAMFALAAAHAAEPRITFEELAVAAAPSAIGAALARAPDDTIWLTWVEPGKDHANTLRFSVLNPAAKTWSAPRTIAADKNVAANSADTPQLASDGRGNVFALWTDGRGGARIAHSNDRGVSWSAPAPFAAHDKGIEMFALATLADGRVRAAWLAGDNPKQLHSQILGDTSPPTTVDASVCDCCPPALMPFPDGSALLAYRGRTRDELRDINLVRIRPIAFSVPRVLNQDDWRLNGCPVNGPRLASDGGRVAAAWFTAADNNPRVLASFSADAGARFLLPLRIDRGHPVGHVDLALLHDGAFLVTWLETDGSWWLRRVTPDFANDDPVQLAAAGEVPTKAFPRMALVRDYAGGTVPAQLVLAVATGKSRRTFLVTVPEGELLEAEKNCDCAPTAEQLRGFPIRGTILEAPSSSTAAKVRVSHVEVPGIFEQGERELKLPPELHAQLLPKGRQFLGRVERRESEWWLFDVRLIATAPKL
jgi:hypothetical protein